MGVCESNQTEGKEPPEEEEEEEGMILKIIWQVSNQRWCRKIINHVGNERNCHDSVMSGRAGSCVGNEMSA